MKNFLKVAALALVAIMLVVSLVSCAPNSNPDKAVEGLKSKGYTAVKDSAALPTVLTLAQVKGVDCVVTGVKAAEKDGEKDNSVVIIYFTDSDSAKNAVEGVKKAITKIGGTEEDAKNIKQSGKLVYFGTDDAISAAG